MRETLKVVIELLAAIPSVVWGFIGLTVMSRLIMNVTGAPVGVNVLNLGGIILALMSVPVIVSIGEDALKAVPDSSLEMEWQLLKRVQMEEGPIPNKYRELIGIGSQPAPNAATARCSTPSSRG